MRPICLLLPLVLLTLLSQPVRAGHAPTTKIFLRIYVQTSGEGMPSTQVTTINLPPSGEQIQIRTLPEVTERDLVAVKPESNGSIRLYFNHDGQVNLSAVTGTNEGRILVVMIDGYVTYAPVIDEQITNGELDIPHPITPQVLQLLQETAADNLKEAKR